MFCEDPKSLFEDKKTLDSFIFQAPRAPLPLPREKEPSRGRGPGRRFSLAARLRLAPLAPRDRSSRALELLPRVALLPRPRPTTAARWARELPAPARANARPFVPSPLLGPSAWRAHPAGRPDRSSGVRRARAFDWLLYLGRRAWASSHQSHATPAGARAPGARRSCGSRPSAGVAGPERGPPRVACLSFPRIKLRCCVPGHLSKIISKNYVRGNRLNF